MVKIGPTKKKKNLEKNFGRKLTRKWRTTMNEALDSLRLNHVKWI